MKFNIFHIFIFVIFILYLCDRFENYENIYESNKILPNEPDDKQFYACRQDKFQDNPEFPFQKYPNSNYRIKKNSVKKPQKGTFSAFLDTHKIRTYDHFYHAPICEDDNESYEFNIDVGNQFRLIPGAFPEEDIQRIYKDEIDKDSHDLRNPNYLYGHPKNISKILYNDKIQDFFLKVKKKTDRYENVTHSGSGFHG